MIVKNDDNNMNNYVGWEKNDTNFEVWNDRFFFLFQIVLDNRYIIGTTFIAICEYRLFLLVFQALIFESTTSVAEQSYLKFVYHTGYFWPESAEWRLENMTILQLLTALFLWQTPRFSFHWRSENEIYILNVWIQSLCTRSIWFSTTEI